MKTSYTRIAMLLHWLMAGLILAPIPLGLYMSDLALSPFKLRLFAYHKWIGMVVLGLWGARVLWRLAHRPPELPPGLPVWQERAANATHGALYVLMGVIPLSGWLMSSALGFTVVLFGVWPLPNLVATDHALGEQLKTVNSLLNDGLMAMLALHLAAVAQHQFVLRDHLLSRMLPGRSK